MFVRVFNFQIYNFQLKINILQHVTDKQTLKSCMNVERPHALNLIE